MEDNTQNNNIEPSEIDKLKTEVEDAKRQGDEYLNGWKRAKADLINYQKDESKRLEEIARFGSEDLLRDVISVIDHLNLAFMSIEKTEGKIDQGLTLIRNQLGDILKKRGVSKIEPKPGDAYNPMYHEAIGMVEPSDKLNGKLISGTIAEEVESGYTLHNYVLKPARVKVVS